MTDEVRKTGIIYCRVSSHEQVKNTSLEHQEKSCRRFAEEGGIDIIQVFVEEGESAKSADRTKFQEAIRLCISKKPKIDFFIVHKIDRFARNQADHVGTEVILRKQGTVLVSASEPVDESVMGKALKGMLSVWAELDNNVRAERSKNGMIEKVKKGYWVWKPPVGYKRLFKGGNLVADESTAPYIRTAFEEWSRGVYSFKSLSDYLAKQGFKTREGKNPCPQLVEKIIRNAAYCGLMKVWGQEFKGAFAPIISEELWIRCQPGMKSKFKSSNRMLTNANFPLRGAVCKCGEPITGSSSTGRKGVKYPYYHHHKKSCEFITSSIPRNNFEKGFIKLLGEISPSNKYESLFKAIVVDVWQSNYKKLDGENTRIRKEIEILEGERQKIFDLHRGGTYLDDEFMDQKKRVNIMIEQKKLLLDEKRIEEFNMEEALSYCFEFTRNSAKTWLELADLPAYRLRFQKQMFPEKITFDGKKFGTTKLSLIYKLNQENGADKSQLVTLPGVEPGFQA